MDCVDWRNKLSGLELRDYISRAMIQPIVVPSDAQIVFLNAFSVVVDGVDGIE